MALVAMGVSGCAGVGEGLVASLTNSDGLYKDKGLLQTYLAVNCVLDLAAGGRSQCTKDNPEFEAQFGGGYLGGQTLVQRAIDQQLPVKRKYTEYAQARCKPQAMVAEGKPIALDASADVTECQTGFLTLWKQQDEICQKAPNADCAAEASYGEFRATLKRAEDSFKVANYLQVRAMTGVMILARQIKSVDMKREIAPMLAAGAGDPAKVIGMVAEAPLKAVQVLTNVASGIRSYGEVMNVTAEATMTQSLQASIDAPVGAIQVASTKPAGADALSSYTNDGGAPPGFGLPPEDSVAPRNKVLVLDSKNDIMDVQKRLKASGHLKANADGAWGAGSKKALRAFKASAGLGDDDVWDEMTRDKVLAIPLKGK
jgi:hypothetical protein